MRVIAGSARSIPLIAPSGNNTRPTTDKIKETLFNILQYDVQGAVFYDIFAGSGAIGIEALSRGAERAVFVDTSRDAINCITANVKKCKFTDKSRIVKADASQLSAYFKKNETENDAQHNKTANDFFDIGNRSVYLRLLISGYNQRHGKNQTNLFSICKSCRSCSLIPGL